MHKPELLWEEEYEKIAQPKFTVVRGCVLRDGQWTEKTLDEWFEATNGDKQSIETVVNHVHLSSLFWQSESETPSEKDMVDIGRKIKFNWEKCLKKQYPSKNMVVVFDEIVPNDGWLGDLQVTAYEK